MRIHSVKIKNFRGYKDEVIVELNDLTVFVGKNDIGKSTILEALDIFFNEKKGVVTLDKDDVNKEALGAGESDILVSVTFDELPSQLIIDESSETSLSEEYLLNKDGRLEVKKIYPNGGKEKVYIVADHPRNAECSGLLLKKIKELQNLVDGNDDIVCGDKRKSSVLRKSIWTHYSDSLDIGETEIEVAKIESKAIYEKLKNYFPYFSLFQSDRKNSDGDSEVQDPLKIAVGQIMDNEEIQNKLSEVAVEVENKLKDVATRTLSKLKEMNPSIAESLHPVLPEMERLKWADVFKSVSIAGDYGIPINKRGSGIKRLVLLNFFRAEAERRREESVKGSIVYAIEEPETAQHTAHQRMLIDALKQLSGESNCQVLLTTHSSTIVKCLDFSNLRLIKLEDHKKTILNVNRRSMPYPSLNEVNFSAFEEASEEYHNELYGHIEHCGLLKHYKSGKPKRPYIRLMRDGATKQESKTLSEYIRHQIHHPENTHNVRFTEQELTSSIEAMRAFIESKYSPQISLYYFAAWAESTHQY